MPFFDSGSADITSTMEGMMAKLVPVLKKLSEKQDIVVEGHTDDRPIRNEYFDSNWELSTARATSVARMLIDKYGLPAARMGAIGYGEHRPVVPNDSPDHRAKNRRVVFFVKMGGAPPPTAPARPAAAAVAPAPASPQTPAVTATPPPVAAPATEAP